MSQTKCQLFDVSVEGPTALKNGTFDLTLGSGGDVTISDGNLVVASGHGIDFSATSDGSGATVQGELLDDYEYGTFTPTLSGVGLDTDYNTREAAYTKIGNVVTVSIFIAMQTNAPSAVIMTVSGLPFTSRSGNPGYHAFGRCWNNNWTGNANSIQWLMSPNATQIGAYYAPASGAVSSQQSSTVGSGGNFIITGSYRTS